MARPNNRSVFYAGSPAMEELKANYDTMNLQEFGRKWGVSLNTVRSTASRNGLSRGHKNRPIKPKPPRQPRVRKSNDAKTVEQPQIVTPPSVPSYTPPEGLVPPNVLKTLHKKSRAWKAPRNRSELNTMPVPYPFSEITDAPYNRGGRDVTPEESGKVLRHSKNR